MPLPDLTAVANLALDHLGEPYLASYETDAGVTADACRLHLPQCVETVLEGHAWSFATRQASLSSTASAVGGVYGTAYVLPADSLRLLRINDEDLDVARNRFEVQARYVLLRETTTELLAISYITNNPPVIEWPTTFADAVCFLLASRLAPKLTQDHNISAAFLGRHEQALGKARSKDTRETRSKENFGPRDLAARSGLVRVRYGKNHPPY